MSDSPSTSPPTPAFISSITTTFPLPPGSPHLASDRRISANPCLPLPFPQYSSQVGQSSTMLHTPKSTLSPPITPACLNVEQEPIDLRFNSISPIPSRRESQYDYELNNELPVPCEFADPRASLKESHHHVEVLKQISEDIEVRIQSSADNLMDVGEEEPYLFEEKSLSDIRDSLTASLDTSIDIDEIENESTQGDEPPTEKRSAPDGGDVETKEEDEEKEDKTEKDSGDSEGTDDTVREKVGSAPGTDSSDENKEECDSKEESEVTTETTETKELAETTTTVSEQSTLETPQETDLDLSESDGGDPAQKHITDASRLSQHETLEEEIKKAIRQESLDEELELRKKKLMDREKKTRCLQRKSEDRTDSLGGKESDKEVADEQIIIAKIGKEPGSVKSYKAEGVLETDIDAIPADCSEKSSPTKKIDEEDEIRDGEHAVDQKQAAVTSETEDSLLSPMSPQSFQSPPFSRPEGMHLPAAS